MAGYIFSAGSARGGTGLLTRMLSVSPKVEIALDPYLGLYKSLRTAMVWAYGSDDIQKYYQQNTPIGDYYFSDKELNILDLIMNNSLDIAFDPKEHEQLVAFLKARAVLSSGDLVSNMDHVQGRNYVELFENGMKHIVDTRKKADLQWVGIHENWTVEFLVPLAKAFPKAKFFILLRDPRAVIASSLKVAEENERGQILSYARSLRKMMACAHHFMNMQLFQGRLMVVRYEDLVVNAAKECQKLCTFLGIPYSADMLNTDLYVEPSTGAVYNGFSSYEKAAAGISTERIHRWKTHLTDDQVALIDFLCGPEMSLFGYAQGKTDGVKLSQANIAETLRADVARTVGWRTDRQNFDLDYQDELKRYSLIGDAKVHDLGLIRRNFLFEDVYEGLIKQTVGA